MQPLHRLSIEDCITKRCNRCIKSAVWSSQLSYSFDYTNKMSQVSDDSETATASQQASNAGDGDDDNDDDGNGNNGNGLGQQLEDDGSDGDDGMLGDESDDDFDVADAEMQGVDPINYNILQSQRGSDILEVQYHQYSCTRTVRLLEDDDVNGQSTKYFTCRNRAWCRATMNCKYNPHDQYYDLKLYGQHSEGCVVDPAAHINAHYRAVILNFAVNHLDAPMAECYEVARQECAANDPLHVQHLLPARSFQSAVSRARSAASSSLNCSSCVYTMVRCGGVSVRQAAGHFHFTLGT